MGIFIFLVYLAAVVEHFKTFEPSTSLKTQLCSGFLTAAVAYPQISFRGAVQAGAVCTRVCWVGNAEIELHDAASSGIFALSKHGLKNHLQSISCFFKKKKKTRNKL